MATRNPFEQAAPAFDRGLRLIACSLTVLVGLLCVCYHLFFIWITSLGTGPAHLARLEPGILLALGNLIYPIAVVGFFTVKAWKPTTARPYVPLIILLLIPVILYLNFVLVSVLLPYDSFL